MLPYSHRKEQPSLQARTKQSNNSNLPMANKRSLVKNISDSLKASHLQTQSKDFKYQIQVQSGVDADLSDSSSTEDSPLAKNVHNQMKKHASPSTLIFKQKEMTKPTDEKNEPTTQPRLLNSLFNQRYLTEKPNRIPFLISVNNNFVEGARKPTHLEKWEKKLEEILGSVFAEKNSDMMKFLLGPGLYKNDISQARDAIHDTEWKLLKNNIKQEVVQQLSYIFSIYEDYLKNKLLFSSLRDDELGLENKPLINAIKTSHQDISKNIFITGLLGYQKWIKSQHGTLALFTEKLDLLSDNEMQVCHKHDQFFTLFKNAFYSIFTRNQLAGNLFQNRSGRMKEKWLESCITEILEKIKKYSTLSEIRKNIETLGKESQNHIKKLSDQLRSNQEYYLKSVINEVEIYNKFATNWLYYQKKNPFLIKVLSANLAAHYAGYTSKELINVIIDYSIYCMPHMSQHILLDKNYRTLISKLITPASEFITMWQHPHFLKMIDFARSYRPNKQPYHLDVGAQQPLTWIQLNQLLAFLVCKSELQQLLKNHLQDYINSWNDDNLIPYLKTWLPINDSTQLDVRKNQIEYLLSCLYLASAFEKDNDILYPNTNDTYLGIPLIRYQIQGLYNGSSLLVDSLTSIQEEILFKRKIMSLANISYEAEKIERERKEMSAEDIFNRATHHTQSSLDQSVIQSINQSSYDKFSVYKRRNSSTFFVIGNTNQSTIFSNASEFNSKTKFKL